MFRHHHVLCIIGTETNRENFCDSLVKLWNVFISIDNLSSGITLVIQVPLILLSFAWKVYSVLCHLWNIRWKNQLFENFSIKISMARTFP